MQLMMLLTDLPYLGNVGDFHNPHNKGFLKRYKKCLVFFTLLCGIIWLGILMTSLGLFFLLPEPKKREFSCITGCIIVVMVLEFLTFDTRPRQNAEGIKFKILLKINIRRHVNCVLRIPACKYLCISGGGDSMWAPRWWMCQLAVRGREKKYS